MLLSDEPHALQAGQTLDHHWGYETLKSQTTYVICDKIIKGYFLISQVSQLWYSSMTVRPTHNQLIVITALWCHRQSANQMREREKAAAWRMSSVNYLGVSIVIQSNRQRSPCHIIAQVQVRRQLQLLHNHYLSHPPRISTGRLIWHTCTSFLLVDRIGYTCIFETSSSMHLQVSFNFLECAKPSKQLPLAELIIYDIVKFLVLVLHFNNKSTCLIFQIYLTSKPHL